MVLRGTLKKDWGRDWKQDPTKLIKTWGKHLSFNDFCIFILRYLIKVSFINK